VDALVPPLLVGTTVSRSKVDPVVMVTEVEAVADTKVVVAVTTVLTNLGHTTLATPSVDLPDVSFPSSQCHKSTS
jgi:hypothetical protein